MPNTHDRGRAFHFEAHCPQDGKEVVCGISVVEVAQVVRVEKVDLKAERGRS